MGDQGLSVEIGFSSFEAFMMSQPSDLSGSVSMDDFIDFTLNSSDF